MSRPRWPARSSCGSCTTRPLIGAARRSRPAIWVDNITAVGASPIGDLDGDGDVDFDDLNILLAAYGTSFGDPGYNADADLDGDGDVDFDDLNILLANYGT